MEFPGNYPIKGKSKDLDEQFDKWWRTLNSIGGFGFLLFISCMGAGEHKYYLAVISSIIFFWALYLGTQDFPKVVAKLNRSSSSEDKLLRKEILKEYLPVIKNFYLFIPYWVGFISISFLATYPGYMNDLSLYIP